MTSVTRAHHFLPISRGADKLPRNFKTSHVKNEILARLSLKRKRQLRAGALTFAALSASFFICALDGKASATPFLAALERFKGFLKGIGDKKFVQENTLKAYAGDAYLDDTLVVHHGAAEIQAYFIKTSETMTSYQVTIDDVARSGNDYYVRWTMIFAAPALSAGNPVHSVGISQIRFNRDGKVEFHRDFWDSGKNFYAHLPVVGGAVGFVRKRLEAN